MRTSGLSLSEVAEQIGTSVDIVRRIVGPLDQEEEAAKRKEYEELARKINTQKLTFAEKAKRFEEETGLGQTAIWRLTRK